MEHIHPLCIMARAPIPSCILSRIADISNTYPNINVLYTGIVNNNLKNEFKGKVNFYKQIPKNNIMTSFSIKSNGKPTRSSFSKQAFMHWLTQSNETFAWHMEDDVLYNGNWSNLLTNIAQTHTDLASCQTTFNSNANWVRGSIASTCRIKQKQCKLPIVKTRWMLLGMSKRYAVKLVSEFSKNYIQGHHEVITGTYCNHISWCQSTQFPNGCLGSWTTRGAYSSSERSENAVSTAERNAESGGEIEPNKLYHPAKCNGFKYDNYDDYDYLGEDSDESEPCIGGTSNSFRHQECSQQKPANNIAVCITGQFSRLEIHTKLKYIPKMLHNNVNIHWFFSMYNETTVYSDAKYINTSIDENSLKLLTMINNKEINILNKKKCTTHLSRWKSYVLNRGKQNLCNLYYQQRSIISCGRQIIKKEKMIGITYDTIIRLRDNTIVQNLPNFNLIETDNFCKQSVHLKSCSENNGYHDKVAVIPRYLLRKTLFSPMKYFLSIDRGEQMTNNIKNIHNAETLLKNALNNANVPVKKKILPFVDGRFQNNKWCYVHPNKDCSLNLISSDYCVTSKITKKHVVKQINLSSKKRITNFILSLMLAKMKKK